jgi:hypothetical protein
MKNVFFWFELFSAVFCVVFAQVGAVVPMEDTRNLSSPGFILGDGYAYRFFT